MDWIRLLWWLGPWCDQTASPKNVLVRDQRIEDNSSNGLNFGLRTYRPTQAHRVAILVLPGLQPQGLNDVRLDRFCRVLAGCGALVGVPELPTMQRAIMEPSLLKEVEQTATAFIEGLNGEGNGTFGLFSISAASIAALHLANHPSFSARISRVHLFGGFADWMEALRFAMTGEILGTDPVEKIVVDPLSLPVVFLNLMVTFPNFTPFQPEEIQTLVQMIHRYVDETWERPDITHPSKTVEIAEQIWTDVSTLSLEHKAFYLEACALKMGGQERVHRCLDSLEELPSTVAWLNPKPLVEKLPMPLDISHGREDCVVPYPQAHTLKTWGTKRIRCFVTGFYHHTGTISFRQMWALLMALPMEIVTSIRLVRAIADLGKDVEDM